MPMTSFLASENNSTKPCPTPSKESSKSFWHSEPDEFLLGHRTTPELPKQADVVVIGCGITGANAARFLVESGRGLNIVVLEAREVCWGATGRNGGHCQPLLFDSPPDVARFELANCAAVKEYVESNDVKCEYRPVTGCRTFWTPEEFKKAQSAVNDLRNQDENTAKHVSIFEDEKQMKEHRVNPKCPGATLTSGAASLWPYKLVAHMVKNLLRDPKVNLQTHTPVEGLSPHGSGRWEVKTARGTIIAKHVICATNGYTSHLLPDFTSLIVPCRGTMSALIPPKQQSGKEEMLPNSYGMKCYSPNATAGSDDYLIQRPFTGVLNPKGHLMFGGGKSEGTLPCFGAEAADDSIVDPGPVMHLRRSLLDMLRLPGETENISELEADYAWSGIMGFSRDAAPWVGQIPDKKGLWICAGYTGHGMPNATLCAKAVTDMLLEAETGGDVEELQEKLKDEGKIPASYLVTHDRIEDVKTLPTVQVQEWTDCMGFVDGRWTVIDTVGLEMKGDVKE